MKTAPVVDLKLNNALVGMKGAAECLFMLTGGSEVAQYGVAPTATIARAPMRKNNPFGRRVHTVNHEA